MPPCPAPPRDLQEKSRGGVARIGALHYGARMRIALASDHAALDLKAALRDWLIEMGHEVADLGPETADSVDYPDFGYKLASVVADGTAERGIALCGSGIGISMSINRNPAVRCALVSEPLSAALAREHNDANCIALGARLTGVDMAKACVSAFLDTEFAGGRHQRRVDKLSNPSL
ncbi:Putative sugar phosphate isomerase YwlF [Qipengyuania sp. 483]